MYDEHPGERDFDFFHGSWNVVNERLTSRLTNSNEWERFEAEGRCESILNGLGNADSLRTNWQGGFEGYSLRLFDRESGKWSIYWADTGGARLLPPVVGEFVDGVGEFYGRDKEGDQDVLVRFRWSHDGPDSARWEQAFSTDQGDKWETNWTMTFTRTDSV
ncbi:MAG: hypothetical protein WBW04_11695 [Nitrolancea sp.]